MNGTDFSIGMLVTFQMFASRLSQPLLRLVGLWQQFQQAKGNRGQTTVSVMNGERHRLL